MTPPFVPPQQRDSLWDRIQQTVAPYPEQLKGYIDQHEVAGARNQGLMALGASLLESSGPSTQRTSLGQALGRGVTAGMGAYQGAVGQLAQQAALRQGMQAQQQGMDFNRLKMEGMKTEMAKVAQLDAARKQILQSRGPLPSDPAQRQEYLTNVMNDLIAAGDTESAGKISEVLKSMGGQSAQHAYEVDKGDAIQLRDPRTNAVLETIPKGISPRDVASGAETRAAVQFQRDFTREQQLARQFEARTKDYAEIADKANVVRSVAANPSAAGDLSLIFAYMKMLDPGSVVREGEFATAANAGSVPDRLWGQYNRMLQGERLAPAVRADFVKQANTLISANQRKLKQVMDQYRRRAQNARVDPDMVVYDYFEGMGGDAAAPAMDARADFGGQ